MMASLSTGKGVIQPVHIDDVLPEVVDRVGMPQSGTGETEALMTGIDEPDAKTGGMGAWRPGIHCRPSFDGEKPNLRWTSSTR